MATFTTTWDSAFEALPADTEKVRLGAGRIRVDIEAVRERFDIEHDMPGDGTGNVRHKFARVATASLPTDIVAGAIAMDTDDELCLVYDGAAWKSVTVGKVNALHYGAAAPTGWTLDATLDNRVIYVDNNAGGTTAGTVDGNAGTLTGFSTVNESAHSHTVDSHTHTIVRVSQNAGTFTAATVYSPTATAAATPGTGGGTAHGHTITHGTFNFKIGISVYITKDAL